MNALDTSVVALREKNRADRQRAGAIAIVSEHLEYYGVIAKHDKFTAENRKQFATRMVDAVIGITRVSHER